MSKTDLTLLPGIGKTFQKDFARIGLTSLADFEGNSPEAMFEQLCAANAREDHATS